MISSTNDFCIFLVIEWAQNKYCLSEHIHTPTTNRIELIARNRVKIKKRNKAFVYVIISTYGKNSCFEYTKNDVLSDFSVFFSSFFLLSSDFCFMDICVNRLTRQINDTGNWTVAVDGVWHNFHSFYGFFELCQLHPTTTALTEYNTLNITIKWILCNAKKNLDSSFLFLGLLSTEIGPNNR